jgi:hypothetical protein
VGWLHEGYGGADWSNGWTDELRTTFPKAAVAALDIGDQALRRFAELKLACDSTEEGRD